MNLQDFSTRVRRDDYQRHKYWFAAAAVGIVLAILIQTLYPFLLTGVGLIGSGVAAIRGGKSGVTGISLASPAGSAGMSWSTRRLEDMAPRERAAHANLTGSFLVLMGTAFLAMVAFYSWVQFRDYRAANTYQAMAGAAGLVSKSLTGGRGLAADSRRVCWDDFNSVAMCSDPLFVETPRIRSDLFQASELVITPRGLVLASQREVTWLVRFTLSERLFAGEAKALTALGSRVAWVHDADVVLADLESEQPLQSAHVVAQVANAEHPLLALSTDTVYYGPTDNCALARQGSDACAVPRERSPCAVGTSPKQLVLLTKRGELWRADAGPSATLTRVASGLSGCLLAVNDRFAFVAGEGPVARVDLGSGTLAIIFRDDPASAIALSDRTLYFRTADKLQGIRLDAPPL